MKDKDKIIEKYKHALVDHYHEYLKVIKELNSQIPLFTDELKKTDGLDYLDSENVERFTYPSFCRKFLSYVRNELEHTTTFTTTTINNIFMEMVEERILQSSASSSGESETLGNECEL